MVSRRTRSQNTLGTRLVEIERKIESESSSKRGNSSEDLRTALAAVEARILLLESVNYRVGADRPALEEAYPQVLSGQGTQITDWDDAVLAGWYWGDSALHSPAESNGWTVGTVYYHGTSGRIAQEVFDPGFADPESDFAGWRRIRVDGSWSAWTEIVSGGSADITGPWPKAPTGLTLALNEGFYTDDGKAQGEVKFTWTGVAQNTENAPMVVDLYEVWIWRGAQSGYQRIATDIAEATFDLTTPGTLHKAKVRARGANGAWGDFSTEVSFTPEYPDETPLPPTSPIVYSEVGQAVVRWDGSLNSAGTPVAPRPGFRHVIVERGTSASGPWFTTGQPLADPGESTVPDTAGITVWFRLISVNVLGIQSPASSAVSVQIKGVTVPDLGTDVSAVIQDAKDTAIDAQDTAVTAISKTTNTALAPTNADGTGKPLGAIWYQYSGANLVGIWQWDGASWVQQYIQSPAIAPGAVDASKIDQTIIDAIDISTSTANNAWDAVSLSVVSVVIEYAANFSETTAPTTGWSTTPPVHAPGTFIWQRTIVTLKNGTVNTTNPVLVTGNTGSGTDGVSVTSVTAYYYSTSSGAAAPTVPTLSTPPAPWTDTEPEYTADTHLWAVTRVTYSNDTFSYTPVSKVSAYTAATEAGKRADDAQLTADGKNRIYPSVIEPVPARINLSTNPRFETGAGSVAVWVNLFGQTDAATSAHWAWNGSATGGGRTFEASSDAPGVSSVSRYTAETINAAGRMGFFLGGLEVGKTYTVGLWSWNDKVQTRLGIHDGTDPAPLAEGPTWEVGEAAFKTMTWTATQTSVRVMSRTLTAATDIVFEVSAGLAVEGTYRGGFFSGAYSSDPDLTPSWNGPVNNSSSTLTGVTPAGYATSASQGVLYRAENGARWIIKTAPTSGWAVSISTPTPPTGKIYTLLLKVKPTWTGTIAARIGGGSEINTPVTAGEWATIRLTRAAGTGTQVGIVARNGANWDWGDSVEIEHTLFTEGAYDGPFFTNFTNGDLWYVLDPANHARVTGVKMWNGTAWGDYQIVADSIVVPGSVGGTLIKDGVITSSHVATKTLTSAQIAAETLSVTELTPNIGSAINIAINPTITDLQNGLDEQSRYYRFDNEGLKIGDPATNEELRLNPGRIEMVQAGNVPTYWEAQNFYVERMIVEAANIGSHRFEGYANGRTVIRPLRGA